MALRTVDAPLTGVNPELVKFVQRFRRAIGLPMIVTSGVRHDATDHAAGRAVDLALRTPAYVRLRHQGDPSYHTSRRLVTAVIAASKKAYVGITVPIVVVFEYDHLHIGLDQPIPGSRLSVGRYLPCETAAGCDREQPLRYYPLEP
jgi:hypothetical protein